MRCRYRCLTICLMLGVAIPAAHGQIARKVENVQQGIGLFKAVRQVFQQQTPLSMEQQQRRGFGIIDEPSLQAPIEQVLARLSSAAGPSATQARVLISADPSFQAIAAEDGSITLSAGLLRQMRSVDELAAVLAHEYVHLQRRHVERTRLDRLKSSWAGLSAIYLDLEHGSKAAQALSPEERYLRHALLRETALMSVQAGLVPARTRPQEDQADSEGVALMVAAGYNPLGMIDFLTALEDFETSNPAALQDKPRNGGVGQTLARFLGNTERARRWGRKSDSDDLIRAGIDAGVTLGEAGLDRAQRTHQDTSKRVQGILDLIDARFSDQDRPEILPAPWPKGSPGFEYLALLDRVQQMLVQQDRQRLEVADRDQKRLLQELSASPVSGSALGRYVQLKFRSGGIKRDEVIALIERELQMPDSLFVTHALAMDVVSDYDSSERALQLHSASMQTFGDNPEMLRYGVRLHRRAGRSEEARNYLMRCAATGSESVRMACQDEL